MAAAAIVVLWGIAWAVMPGIVKSQLEKIAGEQLGRKVSIGAVSFRPWSLELTLEDLAVSSAQGASSQLRVQRIYIDAELQSVLRLAPVVDALVVEGVNAKLTHFGDGHYDVDDILDRLAASSRSQPGPAQPPGFALYNLALRGGALDFVDQTVNRTHELRELTFSIPFLSNLASQREVKTEPRLAFRLNGSRFDSAAQTTPFASTHKTDAVIRLADLDLQPYLAYVPRGMPVKLLAGVVGADLRLAFEQAGKPSVRFSGTLDLKGARIANARGQELLALEALRMGLDDVRPLERVLKLASIELTGPDLAIRRDQAGRINLLNLIGDKEAAKKGASSANDTRAGDAARAPSNPWKVDIARIAVRTGQVHWTDAATAPQAQLDLRDLTLDASELVWPLAKPMQLGGSFALETRADTRAAKVLLPAASDATRVNFSGSVSDQAASVTAALDSLPLALAAPYISQVLEPTLGGSLSAQLGLQWKAPDLQLQATTLSVNNLTLAMRGALRKGTSVSVKKIEVTDARLDWGQQAVTLGQLAVTQPIVAVERGEDRRWMFEHWLKPERASSAAPAPAPVGSQAGAKPWRVAVQNFGLEGGAIHYADRATVRPVVLDVAALSVQVKNLATDSRQPGPIKLSARIKAGPGEPGQLGFSGSVGLQPLALQGKVQASRIPAHALAPYLADVLQVELLRADAGFRGDLRYTGSAQGAAFKLSGDTVLEELRANTLPNARAGAGELPLGQELLSWKALNLRGLDVALAPGQATRMGVKEAALTDFYARVIINETGRINLQDLVSSTAAADTPVATPFAVAASQAVSAAGPAPERRDAPAGRPEPVISIGQVSLVNGRVLFSDRFIKPNYTAHLTELTGRLSAFSSVPASSLPGAIPASPLMADLELRGRAEGSASLEIVGKLNPLAKPLALDIQGKMRDLELPPLSPYSIKYAGHGIERGKLAMDVAYQVLPDGQLTASNNLMLNQLTFGEAIEGAPKTLPVRLAVALLADRHGVIDINLPISGSLNDPEFRLGSIIFKVVVNLIVKAVTSPFSLLSAALGGGGDELGMVGFAPGSAVLGAEAKESLDKVVKAMNDRPSLNMTVVGTASLEAEREAFKRERLKALLLAEKRRAAVVAGKVAHEVAPVSAAEAPALLKDVYRRAEMPKPRNLLGFAKDLPPAEMEALLLAHIPVTEEAIRELAVARGTAVKDYLSTRELTPERLFLGAPKPVAADAKWFPRAELELATQ